MSLRNNNYGRPAAHPGALQATRRFIASQPTGAGFGSPPPVKQWVCSCGMVNSASRDKCRACGEAGGVT